jgi:mannosyltransferase OCH1-like enzyme
MSARLLALLLSAVTALEPTVLDDIAAVREHSYIRRKPACAKAGDASNVAPLPKVLHQMWWQGEAAVPDDYATMRTSWAATHPSWTIKLWDEAKATALINNSYAWFAPTFHTLPSKIQKADAARYAILHSEGGVYADMDVEAFRPLDEVLTPRGAAPTIHLFEEPATHWEAHGTVISNGMMAAPPKHPLLLLSSTRSAPSPPSSPQAALTCSRLLSHVVMLRRRRLERRVAPTRHAAAI